MNKFWVVHDKKCQIVSYPVHLLSNGFLYKNKYFDEWRAITIGEEIGELKYKNDYAKTVTIHQLRKPLVGLSKALGPLRANIGIGGGSVYSVELREAFPTTVSAIQLNNDLDGLVELTVEMSYTNWYTAEAQQNFLNASLSSPIGSIDLI